jgi:putative Mg2+ transporter-C (MgtC) family protein
MELLVEDITKLLFAVVIGGIIGAEREVRSRSAGFRTIILICVGSTLFTIISAKIGGPANPDRIAANIITGIGFIGAGVIFRDAGHISGITTAATIWIAAAVGMSIGGGHFLLAGYTTLMVIVVLWGFSKLETVLDNALQLRTYRIILHGGQQKLEQIIAAGHECGLRTKEHGFEKVGGNLVNLVDAKGSAKSHKQFTEKLFADTEVVEFRFR